MSFCCVFFFSCVFSLVLSTKRPVLRSLLPASLFEPFVDGAQVHHPATQKTHQCVARALPVPLSPRDYRNVCHHQGTGNVRKTCGQFLWRLRVHAHCLFTLRSQQPWMNMSLQDTHQEMRNTALECVTWCVLPPRSGRLSSRWPGEELEPPSAMWEG